MRQQNTEGFGSRCLRWFRVIGLTFNGLLLVVATSHAGILDVSWIAPIANSDGSPLTELALFRVYYSEFDAPCPGSTFVEVASSSAIPPPNQAISLRLTGLTTGSYYNVSVTALDARGSESACSDTASAVARDDSDTTPSTQDDSAASISQAEPAPGLSVQDGSASTTSTFCPPRWARRGRC